MRTGEMTAGGAMLFRIAGRGERVKAPFGVIALAILVMVTGASMSSLYATAASRAELRSGAASNPAFRLLLGRLGADDSIAAITTWRVGLFGLLVAAVLAALIVTRNTRAQEDSGRLEVIRAGVVGSLAPMLGAIGVAVGAVLATGVLMALATAAIGATVVTAAAVGLQYAAVGLAAIGVAAVTNQVFATARGASVAAVTLLVGGYVLRGIADLADGAGWLRWVSPLGWAERIDPFGAQNLLPAALSVVLFGLGVGAAAAIAVRRDLGEGVLASRAGPSGSSRLGSVESLMTRVSIPIVAPWVAATAAYCLLLGFLLSSVDDLVPASGGVTDVVRDLGGGGDIARSVMNAVLGFVGVIAALAAMALIVRVRGDESSGRAEQMLATATSRTRYFLSVAGVTLTATVLVVAGASLAIAAGHLISAGATASPSLGDVLVAGGVQVPGSVAVASVCVAAYGWGMRWVSLGWLAVLADTLFAQFGTLLRIPMWLRDLAPHTRVMAIDPSAIGVGPLIVPLAAAVALIALGWWGFRRRNVPG